MQTLIPYSGFKTDDGSYDLDVRYKKISLYGPTAVDENVEVAPFNIYNYEITNYDTFSTYDVYVVGNQMGTSNHHILTPSEIGVYKNFTLQPSSIVDPALKIVIVRNGIKREFPIQVLAISAPVNTIAPTITGVAFASTDSNRPAGTLTCNKGTWSGYPIPTFTYKWTYADGTNIAIANPNLSNITLNNTSLFTGKQLKCTVTATNVVGSNSVITNVSSNIEQIPTITGIPQLSGSGLTVGTTYTCTTGTWVGYPTPTYTYKWVLNPTPSPTIISGATSSSYSITANEIGQGKLLACIITATNKTVTSGNNTTKIDNNIQSTSNVSVMHYEPPGQLDFVTESDIMKFDLSDNIHTASTYAKLGIYEFSPGSCTSIKIHLRLYKAITELIKESVIDVTIGYNYSTSHVDSNGNAIYIDYHPITLDDLIKNTSYLLNVYAYGTAPDGVTLYGPIAAYPLTTMNGDYVLSTKISIDTSENLTITTNSYTTKIEAVLVGGGGGGGYGEEISGYGGGGGGGAGAYKKISKLCSGSSIYPFKIGDNGQGGGMGPLSPDGEDGGDTMLHIGDLNAFANGGKGGKGGTDGAGGAGGAGGVTPDTTTSVLEYNDGNGGTNGTISAHGVGGAGRPFDTVGYGGQGGGLGANASSNPGGIGMIIFTEYN